MSFEYYEKCVRSCADLRAMSHVETTKPCVCSGLVGLFSSLRSEALVKKPQERFFPSLTFLFARMEPLNVSQSQTSTVDAPSSLHISTCTDHQPYYRRRSELTAHHRCFLWGALVIISLSLQRNVLNELHSSHCGSARMKEHARSYVW